MLFDMKTTEIISYTLSDNYSTPMVLNTIREGLLKFPKKILKNLILHSDRDSQFTSKEYEETLKYYGITQSVSLPVHPRDNGVIERFLEHLKDEIDLKKVKSFKNAVDIIDEYIYDYNYKRKQ